MYDVIVLLCDNECEGTGYFKVYIFNNVYVKHCNGVLLKTISYCVRCPNHLFYYNDIQLHHVFQVVIISRLKLSFY